jgi:hypothetical protein
MSVSDAIDTLAKRIVEVGKDAVVAEARSRLADLRNQRAFRQVDAFAAALASILDDPGIALQHAQGLIELGKLDDAIGVLGGLAGKVQQPSDEMIETNGLLGRAYKQKFFAEADPVGDPAKDAIGKALDHYGQAYAAQPGKNSVWPGLNMLALSAFATRTGLPVATGIDVRAFARELLDALDDTPPAERDNWYHGSRAEAYLGLGDLNAVEAQIGRYVRNEATTAFALGGTLRQFVDLWGLDKAGEQGRGIVQALRAGLLKKENGRLDLSPAQVVDTLQGSAPSEGQLQAILGNEGLKTYEWWLKAVTVAQSIGAIKTLDRGRVGTGFLVRGGDVIEALGDELILVTNFHVVSDPPHPLAVTPDKATVAFEAAAKSFGFAEILWQCPVVDCTLLRLDSQPDSLKPLALDRHLPIIPKNPAQKKPQVFVIGYPRGGELSYSFQDNVLLDHEGPPDGTPPSPAVRRLQYRAPTEHGSSGSPVFESSLWRVIGLHHAGDTAMPFLNGHPGTGPANEGIWIQSIIAAARENKVP